MLCAVGSGHDNSIFLDMEVDVAFERDEACEPYASRDNKMTSTFFIKCFDGFVEGLGVEGDSIAYGSEVFKVYTIVWDYCYFRLLHFYGHVLIVGAVVGSISRYAKEHSESKGHDFLHVVRNCLFCRICFSRV